VEAEDNAAGPPGEDFALLVARALDMRARATT
jgi:hypothetical protein